MSVPRTISGMPCGVRTASLCVSASLRETSPRLVVAAIHGIMTRTTTTSWPDRFDAWMWEKDPSIKVIKKEYRAGPFPRWNVWIKNRLEARSLASELMLFAEKGAEIAMVAHSNGGDIALKASHILTAKGIPVRALVLTGAAVEADVRKNGILEMVQEGMLGRAVAYSSPYDHAVRSPLIWPWGHLGYSGFTRDGKVFCDSQILTRWFNCSHGGYFKDEAIAPWETTTYRERTFRKFYEDIMGATA